MNSPPKTLRLVEQDETLKLPRASLTLRFGARLMDCLIAWGLFAATGRFGAVAALIYILFADGLFRGQSPGKRLFGVKVLRVDLKKSGGFRESVSRNSIFGFIFLLLMLPAYAPQIFAVGVACLGGLELFATLRSPEGRRLGDRWAATQVVDGRVPADGAAANSTEPVWRASKTSAHWRRVA